MRSAPAPIALFVYNRLTHVRRTVQALQANGEAKFSDLHIFSDGPRDLSQHDAVKSVREYVAGIDGFKKITLYSRARNFGLARSIIEGVTSICDRDGRVIVVEDDLVASRFFLRYLNDGLEMYQADNSVASIHAYCYPHAESLPETFFMRGADCWGWATWGRAWQNFEAEGKTLLRNLERKNLLHEFDLGGQAQYVRMLQDQIDGRNDSWAIRWHASAYLAGLYTLYPNRSLVQNIGNDASGTHSARSGRFKSATADRPVNVCRIEICESAEARRAFGEFFLKGKQVRSGLQLARALLKRLSRIWGAR